MKLIPSDDPSILVFIPADLPPESKIKSAGTSSGMKSNIDGSSDGMKIEPSEDPPILAFFFELMQLQLKKKQ